MSLIATNKAKLSEKSPVNLTSANGQKIQSGNFEKLTIKLQGQKYTWSFVQADIVISILGADFMCAHAMVVDLYNQKLLSLKSHKPITAKHLPKEIDSNAVSNIQCSFETQFGRLWDEFPTLLKPNFHAKTMPHGVELAIETTGEPVFCRPRRLDEVKFKAMKQEFQQMLDLGIIEPSNGPWASPLHVVPKGDGSWRPCGDYRKLNTLTVPDKYCIPNLQDFTRNLHNKTIFSKIDLVKSYYQVPVREADIPKTAVATPFGTYAWRRMPFGLRNSGQTFQRLLDIVCNGLNNTFVYIDDCLIASSSPEEHLKDLRALFKRLSDNGLNVNREKSELGKTTLTFLGHKITAEGAAPLEDRVVELNEKVEPKTVRQLKSFLGFVNFYHRFIPHCSAIMQPLHKAAAAKMSSLIDWNPEMRRSFLNVKKALSEAVMLSYPDENGAYILTTDASDIAAGGVLEQLGKSGKKPLGFFSKLFNDTQKRYSTFDRELTAIFLAIKYFQHFIDGRKLVIYTDHKPLVSALHKNTDLLSARQQRQMSFISEFTCDLRHVKGEENTIADLLSRPPAENVKNLENIEDSELICAIQCDEKTLGLDLKEVAEKQLTCDGVRLLKENSALKPKFVRIKSGEKLWMDISCHPPRILLPSVFKRSVFDNVHNLAHVGPKATLRQLSKYVVWFNMKKDVQGWAKSCHECNVSKIHRHTRTPIGHFSPPPERFAHVHVDLVGPLNSSNGKRYILTCIDRYSRWPVAVAIDDKTAKTTAKAFIENWVSVYGPPSHLTSDQGAEFCNHLWAEMARGLGTELHRTTAFHPQANGMVERFHRRLKSALVARLLGSDDWPDELPWVMLGLRTAPCADTDLSPAEVVFGSPLWLPGALTPLGIDQPQAEFIKDLRGRIPGRPIPITRHAKDRQYLPIELKNAKHIYLRAQTWGLGLAPRYNGPFRVIEMNEKTVKIQGNQGEEIVSIDRVKPAPPLQAEPISGGSREAV